MKRKKNDKKILLKLRTTAVRVFQKEQGMFDGRFRTRTEASAKQYSRKLKHKKNFKNTEG
jgi:hypothetical protein